MTKLNLLTFSNIKNNRKVTIVTAAVVLVLIIIDLLATRQILYFNNNSEIILFILTVLIAYGIGSWILLGFAKHITKELRARSHLINIMHWTLTIIQFSLLGILLFILYNNIINCHDYFSLCNGTRSLTTSVNAISSVAASIIMGIFSFKLFSWFKSNNRNFMVLFYGLAAAALAISIAGDAFDKLYLANVVEERTPPGAVPQSSFIYKTFEKYHGEIEYKVVNPQTTTLYVVPTSKLDLYNQIIYWTSDAPYILTWAGTALLLGYYYKTTRKLDFKFWIILAVPLILYLVGSGLIFSLPSDIPYRFYIRLVFRAGTIASSLLFGLAFYVTARNLKSVKIKDYLTIAAVGIATVGIANEISALQQTYGVAAHSLVLLSSYLFVIGLYSSALSVSQDSSLRKLVKKSTVGLLDNIATAEMEQQTLRRIMKMVQDDQQKMEEKSGISSSMTEEDIKQYVEQTIMETRKLK
jgi:hypothetical protein